MTKPRYLLVGGLVAMGFDSSGNYLLTISHSGRGVFATDTWVRVSRDDKPQYPEDGKAIGIGPIVGEVIKVEQRDETRDKIEMMSPDGKYRLLGESEGITLMEKTPNQAL